MHYLWVGIEKFGVVLLKVIGMILLARVLNPNDFGLFGMVYVITALGQVLIDSGMGGALIKKMDANEEDYVTVFTFNLLVSILIWTILYFMSDLIALFYNEEQLTDIIPLLATVLVIRALSIVPVTKLTKSLNFKKQSKIVLSSYFISLLVGYYLAINEFGVYSLIFMSICEVSIFFVFIMHASKYKLKVGFNLNSFRDLYGFGLKLSIASIIRTFYENVLNVFIGKLYGSVSLGFYYQARKVNDVFIGTTTNIINKAAFPILVNEIKRDGDVKLKMRGLISNVCWLTFIVFVLFSVHSMEVISLILGKDWLESAWILKIIVLSGFGMIIEATTRCFLKSYGFAGIILKLEIKKRLIGVFVISLSSFFGVVGMLVAYVLTTIVSSFLNMYEVDKITEYSMREQLLDIFKPLSFSFFVYAYCELFKYYSSVFELDVFIYIFGLFIPVFIYFLFFLKFNSNVRKKFMDVCNF
ncbi:lipopolysaccharide biosynthesis protein [Vibrio alginolyticus]|uniref:lipopolysaccharide biosynthesis protein n=1 Tax=Vibrio alginolyticus TaxID=663 RepID=UPI001BD50EBB|nr:lipopolysaccharide biosynthesis protein [Vibrio alginolyticus]MBS9933702.1 lipopolysaccharide biosynthesis protein [Vibrio alginolyticus]